MTAVLTNVSRETIDRLRAFENIVRKWTARINLISRDSLDNIWDRHILDSVQIFQSVPPDFVHWADLGSGGGFPGVVVAILVSDMPEIPTVSLIESDARKCAFLRAAIRETGATAQVINQRIEAVDRLNADVVSARALSDLSSLVSYAERHLAPDGTAIFAKGARWKEELAAARSKWNFDLEAVSSSLAAEAAILKITGVSRV